MERIDAPTLRLQLNDGAEIALLDAREEVPFDARHLLMASCVPLGCLEEIVDALVPRRDVRVVWCDDGGDLAERAAARMTALGYSDVSVLAGGVDGWDAAGFPMYSGVHVPSKAFAEVVEHEAGTPYISAEELQGLIDDGSDIAIYDTRSYEEYHSNSIPGAISVPGAEIVYRFTDLTPSPDTMVIVNCGGRTRSIIGAQALINAGFSNKIVSLMNGTQAWHLSGFEVVKGATRRPPPVSEKGLATALDAAARVKSKFNIREIDAQGLAAWHSESKGRSLFLLDVRTPEEYEAGHMPGSRLAPGGQLIQETDTFVGVWNSRIVLVDDNGVRAAMTASWMLQMGWSDVAIHAFDPTSLDLQTGPYRPMVVGENGHAQLIEAAALQGRIQSDSAIVVDVTSSKAYRDGHIPDAWFMLRTYLTDALDKLPKSGCIVFTSPDGALARLAAVDVAASGFSGTAMALEGGTQAWVAAGLDLQAGATHMATPPDDIRLKAREQSGDVEAAMNAYLTWEINLVNQMSEDPDNRFKVMAKR